MPYQNETNVNTIKKSKCMGVEETLIWHIESDIRKLKKNIDLLPTLNIEHRLERLKKLNFGMYEDLHNKLQELKYPKFFIAKSEFNTLSI